MRTLLLAMLVTLGAAARATAQSSALPPDYAPISDTDRAEWVVNGTVGPRSLGIGVLSSTWQTAWNSPEEWQRSWSGLAKRYGSREANVAISNSIEAGLGALWGEDPRYIRATARPLGARVAHAARMTVLAPYRDGAVRPAWGRYAGNVFNNVIENAWLPPSVTSPGQTAWRSATGFLGRFAGNLWSEFWPDVRDRLRR